MLLSSFSVGSASSLSAARVIGWVVGAPFVRRWFCFRCVTGGRFLCTVFSDLGAAIWWGRFFSRSLVPRSVSVSRYPGGGYCVFVPVSLFGGCSRA